MFVVYDEIRLDPLGMPVDVIDSDWVIHPKTNSLQHLPTQTAFEIRMDDKESQPGPLTPMHFSAHLVAIRQGCALPPQETIEGLGRAALALYFVALGFIAPGEPAEANLPAATKQTYVC